MGDAEHGQSDSPQGEGGSSKMGVDMSEQEAIEAEVVADGAEQASANPIDGDRTAKKNQGRRPNSRPATTKYNWPAIKRRWCNGDDVQAIADDHGCPKRSIYQKAYNARWPHRENPVPAHLPARQAQPQVAAIVEQAAKEQVIQQMPQISAEIKQRLNGWFDKVLKGADNIYSHLDSKIEGKLEVEEIKSLASTLATLDTTVRRTFGLDSPDGRNLGVLASCRASVECPFEPAPQSVAAAPSGDGGGSAASVATP